MGGFLYARKVGAEDVEAVGRRCARSLAALDARGLRLTAELDRKEFVVYLFKKARVEPDNCLLIGERDFVIATGTMFYRGEFGQPALKALYEDFPRQPDIFSHLAGHYCALVNKDGLLHVFNDLGGAHHLYASSDRSVVSTSFLAVTKSLSGLETSTQGVYEYLIEGATYGEETVFKNVQRLDSDYVVQLSPELGRFAKTSSFVPLDGTQPVESLVERVSDAFESYFKIVHKHFGDSISIGLSGGYDSRHLLGLLFKSGSRPYVYVYGPPESEDVRFARSIADGEAFAIHHFDKGAEPQKSPGDVAEIVKEQYYFFDGLSLFGAFGNGSEMVSRLMRTEGGRLQISGITGEIYRNVFLLADRPISIQGFLRARHNWADWKVVGCEFNRKEFFYRLGEKIKGSISLASDQFTRRQLEMMYPRFRGRYRNAPTITTNNIQAYALGPFTEAAFYIPSWGIPLEAKNHGRFHAALIRQVAPRLARYTSVYGHPFDRPVPIGARLRTAAAVHLSRPLQPLFRFVKGRRQRRSTMPWYLAEECVGAVLGTGPLEVSRYICLDRIKSASLLNRALTLELVLTDRL